MYNNNHTLHSKPGTITLSKRENPEVIAMMVFFTFSKIHRLMPHNQIQLNVISKTLIVGGLTLVQRRCLRFFL